MKPPIDLATHTAIFIFCGRLPSGAPWLNVGRISEDARELKIEYSVSSPTEVMRAIKDPSPFAIVFIPKTAKPVTFVTGDKPVATVGGKHGGDIVNGLGVALAVEPAAWLPGAEVALTCVVRNASDKPLRVLDWAASWTGLTLLDSKGRAVEKGGGSNQARQLAKTDWPLIAAGRDQSFVIRGTFSKGKFVIPVKTGGIIHWPNMGNESLAAGACSLIARIGDARPSGGGLALDNLWPGPEAASIPAQVTIEDKAGPPNKAADAP
jgi:hypothetical protein